MRLRKDDVTLCPLRSSGERVVVAAGNLLWFLAGNLISSDTEWLSSPTLLKALNVLA
jgi:hypothetical protein